MPKIVLQGATQIALLIWVLYGLPNLVWAQFENQHDVKFIVSALESPIPDDVVAEAREFDDQLMLKGEIEGTKVYLVTDNRSKRVNALVRKLLVAMGQENREWVVRVLDTKLPTTNAFVVGGKYIYVFTGLLKEASSDDELAFVLAHELGHSLLKHNLRRKQDMTNILSGLAEVIAAIASKEAYEDVTGVTKALRASYNQSDEEESDAIAAAITWRSGFDPLRGADFFTRGKRKISEYKEQKETLLLQKQQLLSQKKAEIEEAQSLCKAWADSVNNSWLPSTSAVNKAKAICNEAEVKRLEYNQMVAEYNIELQEQKIEQIDEEIAAFYSSHPNSQNRVAAIAMLTDYLHGRRPLESLQKFQQSYSVMLALKQMDSVLLKPPVKKAVQPKLDREQPTRPEKNLTEELQQLKRARDLDLITEDEYHLKRQQIMDRF